jgi:hypothetical protein
MTAYQSGAAFRRALEDRLRARSLQSGIPLARLRKIVAFDRFLARLIYLQPEQWILKGGFAIELRLADRARATKDIDVLALLTNNEIYPSLRRAGALDLENWFEFEVQRAQERSLEQPGNLRFNILSLLDGRIFEEFHIDVGMGDPVIDPIEYLAGPSLLDFSDIQRTIIPCYPITQQIAEKIHAYTLPHTSGESSRVKDFIDILLLAELGRIDAARLQQAVRATFEARDTHTLPHEMPDPPAGWARPYQRLAAQVVLSYQTLGEADRAIKKFLNPILMGEADGQWDPERRVWG